MNIEILAGYIKQFEKEVIESGFYRDLQDFINSLPANQANIIGLREITEKVMNYLDEIYSGDLPDALNTLFPTQEKRPFSDSDFLESLSGIYNNKEIQQDQYFNELTQLLGQLNNQLQITAKEINRLEDFFNPFVKREEIELSSENYATVSIVFKDHGTITSLKSFTKTLNSWNRILPLYHQVLSSEPPKDIEIKEIQNGSIDVLINLDFNIAINFADLFQVGFKSYIAYLSYKSIVKPITDTYRGNKKLLDGEKQREIDLLENIEITIDEKLKSQHNNAMKKDKKIDGNIHKKVEQIVKLVTSHIVKGNDLKLLTMPEQESEDEQEKGESIKQELKTSSSNFRKALDSTPKKELIKLIEMYSSEDVDNDEE